MHTLANVVAALAARIARTGLARRWAARRVERCLGAGDARVVVHAAAWIARCRWRGFEAPLHRALATWSTAAGDDARVVGAFVLDALLRSGAGVPAALLRPLLTTNGSDAAFVLAARAPAVHEAALLAAFRLGPERVGALRWTAAGHWLTHLRTPGFAAALLGGVDWAVVRADEPPAATIAARWLAPDVAVPTPAVHRCAGHALPRYTLLADAAGDGVIADGEPRIGHRRDLLPAPALVAPAAAIDLDALREHWLRCLAPGVTVATRATVAGDAGADTIARAADELAAGRRTLLQALRAGGLLALAEVVAANVPVRCPAAPLAVAFAPERVRHLRLTAS